MREVVIVSAVRTPVGKAYKGTLRATRPDDLAAVAIKGALERVPQVDPKEIEDVIFGCAMRSEERRVGKEGRSRGSPYHLKKKEQPRRKGDGVLPDSRSWRRSSPSKRESRRRCGVQHGSAAGAEGGRRDAGFFFSSRRRHTRCLSDWSSDVCSSDLYHGKNRRLNGHQKSNAG